MKARPVTVFEPFGRTRLPLTPRERRVVLVKEAADALIAGRVPSAEARLFVGAALKQLLQGAGGADPFDIRPRQGSHKTPDRILQSLLTKELGDDN